jgi:hypothetical protein
MTSSSSISNCPKYEPATPPVSPLYSHDINAISPKIKPISLSDIPSPIPSPPKVVKPQAHQLPPTALISLTVELDAPTLLLTKGWKGYSLSQLHAYFLKYNIPYVVGMKKEKLAKILYLFVFPEEQSSIQQ